jgi:3-methyladenine DNA glycosylase AlkD
MADRLEQVMSRLHALADPNWAAGMAHGGINTQQALGVAIPKLRLLAKDIGRDHALALALWETGIHEARILASMLADPKQVTQALMEAWAADFNSWDLVDQVCGNLFDRTPYAYSQALAWSERPQEFVRRAGFALMAWLAVHDKKAADARFEPFFPAILRQATDQRNFVKKAVNWGLRNIGKRNLALNAYAIATAQQMAQLDDKTAQWNAKDALKELTSEAVQTRLGKKT